MLLSTLLLRRRQEEEGSGGDGTVVKAIPCNHRVKYQDGQWDNLLFAEEPGYVVVRRETSPAEAPSLDNGW